MNAEHTNYDLLYNPRLTVERYEKIFERWQRDAQKARAQLDCYLDVPYGADGTETMDIFRARGSSKGLLMFIHGGYWRALDKSDFSFVAPALADAGITVAVPNYALCPNVQVRDIVMQMVQAGAWLYRNGSNFGAPCGNLHVAGHSSGGHLAAMLLACQWPAYARDLPKQVVRSALSVSGVYDLREIVRVPTVNCDVKLTERSALVVSPVFLPPATDAPFYTAVGGDENEGFHIQNAIVANKWKRVHKADIACPGDNHFTVLDRLTRPDSALFKTVLRMMGI
jgi:arylformamidase